MPTLSQRWCVEEHKGCHFVQIFHLCYHHKGAHSHYPYLDEKYYFKRSEVFNYQPNEQPSDLLSWAYCLMKVYFVMPNLPRGQISAGIFPCVCCSRTVSRRDQTRSRLHYCWALSVLSLGCSGKRSHVHEYLMLQMWASDPWFCSGIYHVQLMGCIISCLLLL